MARRQRVAYRKRQQNRFSMFLATLVVVLILVLVGVKSIELRDKIDQKRTEAAPSWTPRERRRSSVPWRSRPWARRYRPRDISRTWPERSLDLCMRMRFFLNRINRKRQRDDEREREAPAFFVAKL